MRKVHLVAEFDPVAAPRAQAGRGPFADAVDREQGGFLERRGEERARGVRLMVFGEDVGPPVGPAQPFVHEARQLEFFVDPLRGGLEE